MPKIIVTQEMIDKTKMADEGFHLVEVKSCEEKVNSKKDGTNYFFSMQIISEGSNQNRYVGNIASSKALGLGLLPLYAAIMGVSMDAIEAAEIDTDAMIGKKCIVEIEHEIYEGKPQARCKNFLPATTNGVSFVE